MPKKAKVKISEIVEFSGFSGRKTLIAFGLPLCASIHLENQAVGTEIEIRVYSENGNISYKSTGSVVAIEPVFPVESYIEALGNFVAIFRYENDENCQKLNFTDRLSVPMPVGWPTPKFLEPTYPHALDI